MSKIATKEPNISCRAKGEGLINIQNTDRWNYSTQAIGWVSMS